MATRLRHSGEPGCVADGRTFQGFNVLLSSTLAYLALRRAMLTERRTSTMLGDVQCAPDMLDDRTLAGGA